MLWKISTQQYPTIRAQCLRIIYVVLVAVAVRLGFSVHTTTTESEGRQHHYHNAAEFVLLSTPPLRTKKYIYKISWFAEEIPVPGTYTPTSVRAEFHTSKIPQPPQSVNNTRELTCGLRPPLFYLVHPPPSHLSGPDPPP